MCVHLSLPPLGGSMMLVIFTSTASGILICSGLSLHECTQIPNRSPSHGIYNSVEKK